MSQKHRHHLDFSRLVVFGDSLSDNGNLFNLIGQPAPPYWNGRFSNGPTYAEQLAQMVNVQLDDRAFGGAQASDTTPPNVPGLAGLGINLPEQVANYIAQLPHHHAPEGTAVLINIGSNDDGGYIISNLPKNAQTVEALVTDVVSNIENAVDALTKVGVEHIILMTLPDLGITPLAQSSGSDVVALAHLLSALNNAGIREIAASHPNVELVDTFQLSEALAADPHAFGFTADVSTPWLQLVAAGSTTFAPNEVGFFDGDHPTYAGHGVIAAFADAVLTSDHVQFLDGTQSVVHAGHGDNFIFATPPDPANLHPISDYTIYGGSGNDIIFAGSGNVTVYGGSGSDLIAAGSGDATLEAGNGTDVLATNSTGSNLLEGGRGDDALIANRGGNNVMVGGSGNELFVLKEGNGLVNGNDSFNFGSQIIDGDHKGNNTLRLIINDQIPGSEKALIAEFGKIEKAFDASMLTNHHGSFQVDGLSVTNLDSLQLQVDSVSKDPSTPYVITHTLLDTDGHGAPVSAPLQAQLLMAEHWGLLTV